MLRQILLLSNQKTSFLSTTIKTYLQEENFDVMLADFDIDEVKKINIIPKLILLNLENIKDKDNQFLSYIGDICTAEDKWVYLCGNENDIKHISSVLPKNIVFGTCSQAFNIPELIKSMNKEIEEEENRLSLALNNSEETEKNILFLSNKKTSFLSSTIKSRLQDEKFNVLFFGFNIDDVNKIKNRPNLILLNFESINDEDKQFLFYLRDLCIEEEKRVYLCGHENDIKDVISSLPKGSIMGTFTRPFNILDLINIMNKEIDKFKLDQGKKHILVVDDSGEMLRAIRSWLSDTYRVSIVNSGANAIFFLANQKPDLILLDYEMPFCSGPQMMEMIRSESSTSSIPIMFLTGKNDKESLMKVLSLKPEGYLLKSTTPEKIKETIGEFFIAQKAKEYNKGK